MIAAGLLRTVVPLPVRRRLSSLPSWSVGVLTGPSPLELAPLPGAAPLRLLPGAGDPRDIAFTADPFAVCRDGIWQLFTEVVRPASRRGAIGLATSADLVTWTYQGIVLEEPFHLSYPCVFQHDGQLWMVPESSAAGGAWLYLQQPDGRWTLDAQLLHGAAIKDSTPLLHDGRWWLFTETSRHHTNDELRLLGSPTLHGPWEEHPASPLVRGDAAAARPAGRPVLWGDRLLRFSQDCATRYGRAVRAYEVRLTRHAYEERLASDGVLGPSGSGWNAAAMHHVDAHQVGDSWVAFADGHP